MLTGIINSARTYFYLPIDDEEYGVSDSDDDPAPHQKHIDWQPLNSQDGSPESIHSFSSSLSSSSSSVSSLLSSGPCLPPTHKAYRRPHDRLILDQILLEDDLYKILGIERLPGDPDKHVLRRAYLSRSRACHPDKFPECPNATRAFQKVSVAYDILSHASTKRSYDSRPTTQHQGFDCFNTRPHADETLRNVLLGVLNDFLEGDLEVVRSFLRAFNDLNPSLRLGEDGIDSVLMTLHSIRERALTCRTCISALHAELSQLLELQAVLRKLSYFDIVSRSRLTIQLVRVTIGIPIKVEEALISKSRCQEDIRSFEAGDATRSVVLPRKVYLVIRGIVIVLEKLEKALN